MEKENNHVRLYCKLIACLAFVPCDFVIDAFILIKSQAPSKLKELLNYFEEFYIGKMGRGKNATRKQPRYEINLWNCFKRTKQGLPRTNNYLVN